jgi:hypothetical protein
LAHGTDTHHHSECGIDQCFDFFHTSSGKLSDDMTKF